MPGKRILLVGAYADDVELNAGGSIHKWQGEGRNVVVAILACHDSQVRHEESEIAGMHLGVNQIPALGGKDASLHDGFNQLLRQLEKLLMRFESDTVIPTSMPTRTTTMRRATGSRSPPRGRSRTF